TQLAHGPGKPAPPYLVGYYPGRDAATLAGAGLVLRPRGACHPGRYGARPGVATGDHPDATRTPLAAPRQAGTHRPDREPGQRGSVCTSSGSDLARDSASTRPLCTRATRLDPARC